jgi:arabinogalactan oligomer/maltooligosaccharide transport system substrate-binding protein
MRPSPLWTAISVVFIGATVLAACGGTATPTEPVTVQLWSEGGTSEDALRFVRAMAEAYQGAHPTVTFEVTSKDPEVLREDWIMTGQSGSGPSLVWTDGEPVRPYAAADLLVPVDDMFVLSDYADSALASVELNGQHWGVPISNGNHLMLYYNKDFLPTPPEDTDALLAIGSDLDGQGITPLVYDQTDPLWLVPWLGGWGGSIVGEDGVTPTLNTPEMVATLSWLEQLRDRAIVPPGLDAEDADSLFRASQTAMIVNGDWAMGDYIDRLGEKLGVARIPTVASTGEAATPYTSATFFMIPSGLDRDTLSVVVDFVKFATNRENQLAMASQLSRLPARKAALEDKSITSDPYLAGSAEQMQVGVPMPSAPEAQCAWDSIGPEMVAVLAEEKSPEDAAAAMQSAAEACLAAP